MANGVPYIKDQFFEDHEKNISFFYTGKANVLGLAYADSVIANRKNAKYIRIATITYDNTLQSSEENIIHEEFLLRVENATSSQYLANSATVKITGHTVGKRVSKNKFKCIVTPEIDYLEIPEIAITENNDPDNGWQIGIWLHSENIKRVYINKLYSHARNSTPINTKYIDSRYYLNLLDDDTLEYDKDTTNLSINVTTNQFTSGVNIYSSLIRRMSNIEAIQYPDIKAAIINTEPSWTPSVEGSAASGYQKITLVNADYSTALSDSFLNIQLGAVNGFNVLEKGLYMVQLVSALNNMSAIHEINVELALFKNNDPIPGTTMCHRLLADNGTRHANISGVGGGSVLVYAAPTDIFSLKFKFLDDIHTGCMNHYNTKIIVTKIMHNPN